jgi:hypothetical protein
MWRTFALWAFRIVLGAIMFCASVGPKDVDSNISDWLDRAGLSALARAVSDQQVDTNALVICAVLLGLTIILPWWSKHFPARPVHVFDTEMREGVTVRDSVEAEVVPANLNRFFSPTVTQEPSREKLTETERDRASAALCEIVDFATGEVLPFYSELSIADSAGPATVTSEAARLEPLRERLAIMANRLWHKHAYYLDLMDFDMMQPLLQTLEALKNALASADEARDWVVDAQKDRTRAVGQLMSDLGGHVGNIRNIAAEKRKEYLE